MKGVFQKITGVVGVLATIGFIVMVGLSPRTEGLCPGLLSSGAQASPDPVQDAAPAEAVADVATDSQTVNAADSLEAFRDSLPTVPAAASSSPNNRK